MENVVVAIGLRIKNEVVTSTSIPLCINSQAENVLYFAYDPRPFFLIGMILHRYVYVKAFFSQYWAALPLLMAVLFKHTVWRK